MHSERAHLAISLVIAAGLLVASGCGGQTANRGAIGGEVKLDGNLLESGSIMFSPFDGAQGAVASGNIKNGRYYLDTPIGPALGWNRVCIQGMRKTGKKIQRPFAPPGEMADEMVEAIPPRFNSESTLKFEVQPGDNTANFEVTSN